MSPNRKWTCALLTMTGFLATVSGASAADDEVLAPRAGEISREAVPGSPAPAGVPPGGLPEAAAKAVDERGYEAVWQVGTPLEGVPAAWQAPNRAAGMRTFFAPEGVRVRPWRQEDGAWHWGLRLRACGRAGALREVPEAQLYVQGSRVEYRRGELVEWYVNDARGLEQGFTLEAPPIPAAGALELAPLELALEVQGGLSPELDPDGRGLRFLHRDGTCRLTYSGLRAWDAEGVLLEARIALEGRMLSILVRDRGARYPLTIDPMILTEDAKLTASDGEADDHFSNAVALDGDTLVVGAQAEGSGRGAVYAFQRVNGIWLQQDKLTASDGEAGDLFGSSVDVNGDTLVVGAPFDDSERGAAYVFRMVGLHWVQEAKLLAVGGQADDDFGVRVALHEDTVIIGAIKVDWSSKGGAAYAFVRTGSVWAQQAKLQPGDWGPGSCFGGSVDVEGDRAVVGRPLDDLGAYQEGSAYVFERSGSSWSQKAKLTASDAEAGDMFGHSISLSGDRVAMGAIYDGDLGQFSGSAYVFENVGGTWSQQAKLLAWDGSEKDQFGFSIALEGDMLVVGARYHDVHGDSYEGALYAYFWACTSWVERAELLASDAGTGIGARLGTSAALSEGTAVGGAPCDDEVAQCAGAAYVYDFPELWEIYCTSKVSSIGCVPHLTACGIPSMTDPNPFEITALEVVNNKPGLFFYGTTGRLAAPFMGGWLCVRPPFRRMPVQGSGGTPPPSQDCSGSLSVDFNDHIRSGADPTLFEGVQVNGQFWYRDPQDPYGYGANTTEAIEFVIQP